MALPVDLVLSELTPRPEPANLFFVFLLFSHFFAFLPLCVVILYFVKSPKKEKENVWYACQACDWQWNIVYIMNDHSHDEWYSCVQT